MAVIKLNKYSLKPLVDRPMIALQTTTCTQTHADMVRVNTEANKHSSHWPVLHVHEQNKCKRFLRKHTLTKPKCAFKLQTRGDLRGEHVMKHNGMLQ